MNKKVLLVCFYDRICLSIRSLSSALKETGHDVHLLFIKDDRVAIIPKFRKDNKYYQIRIGSRRVGCGEDVNPITDYEIGLVKDLCAQINPDVIGISARSVAKELSRKIVSELRTTSPNARYIGGGYGPSAEPEYFLKFLDYVCIGEGDAVINDLVSNDDPTSVNNAAFLYDGDVTINKLEGPVNLDTLLYPDWDFKNKYLIDDNSIKRGTGMYHAETYDIFATRGCAASCTYCCACQWGNIYKSYGAIFPKIRLRSVNSVIEELKHALNAHNIKHIRFKDSIFGINKKWLFEFMDLYDKEIELPFICYLDERYTDEDIIRRLRDSGLSQTIVGIQSVSEKIRRNVMT